MRKNKFKVVKRKNNKSCIVHGNSEFCLTYEKDTTVYAPDGTLGIMVFNNHFDATLWIQEWDREDIWKIKRVVPIGRGKTPKFISDLADTDNIREFCKYLVLNKLYKLGISYIREPIEGTICYPAVFVVD